MKRIILILVVIAVGGGYFAHDYFQGKAKGKTAQYK